MHSISEATQATATFLAKADGTLAGVAVADMVFGLVDPSLKAEWSKQGGFQRASCVQRQAGAAVASTACDVAYDAARAEGSGAGESQERARKAVARAVSLAAQASGAPPCSQPSKANT